MFAWIVSLASAYISKHSASTWSMARSAGAKPVSSNSRMWSSSCSNSVISYLYLSGKPLLWSKASRPATIVLTAPSTVIGVPFRKDVGPIAVNEAPMKSWAMRRSRRVMLAR